MSTSKYRAKSSYVAKNKRGESNSGPNSSKKNPSTSSTKTIEKFDNNISNSPYMKNGGTEKHNGVEFENKKKLYQSNHMIQLYQY